MNAAAGVTVVIPVHNGAAFIRDTMAAVMRHVCTRPSVEVIVVNDRSDDRSAEVLQELASIWPISVLAGAGRGVSAALNVGIRAARYPFICQIDQDVTVHSGWLEALLAAFDDDGVAAAQGCYVTNPRAAPLGRVMGLDLELRYAAIRGTDTDHVCTGNVVYRADALHAVGLFDETLGYGADNDISYRLRDGGYRLKFCRDARSSHRWREGLTGYVAQQYGFGYGRLDLVAKHPNRYRGDTVSPVGMMLHPALASAGIACLIWAVAAAMLHGAWLLPAALGAAAFLSLMAERTMAAVRAFRRFGDRAALLFPLAHLLRDLTWVTAAAVWSLRRFAGQPRDPRQSMRGRPRPPDPTLPTGPPAGRRNDVRLRMLAIIPAHNEAANLPRVVADLRWHRPDLDILVVDDGSSDETACVIERLDVRWLGWETRRGVGAAVRAGLRYASRSAFDVVVRIDADGQHGADDIERLVQPIVRGDAEVVLGSRYTSRTRPRRGVVGVMQWFLARSLSVLIRGRVTDATSGFCALGPRAIRVLAEHHPSGYPEPELRLFLSRNAWRVMEVPVRAHVRLSGRTSLTPLRVVAAGARVLLAMVIVPLRPTVGPPGE